MARTCHPCQDGISYSGTVGSDSLLTSGAVRLPCTHSSDRHNLLLLFLLLTDANSTAHCPTPPSASIHVDKLVETSRTISRENSVIRWFTPSQKTLWLASHLDMATLLQTFLPFLVTLYPSQNNFSFFKTRNRQLLPSSVRFGVSSRD